MRASDQCNRIQLSNEIVLTRERKFPVIDEDDEFDDIQDQFDEQEFRSDTESESVVESRYVSPNNKYKDVKVKRSREEESSDLENPPPTKKALLPKRKSRNPFAKTKSESPVKTGPMKSKFKSEKAQMTLSRLSTFSAQARQETKKGKNIV